MPWKAVETRIGQAVAVQSLKAIDVSTRTFRQLDGERLDSVAKAGRLETSIGEPFAFRREIDVPATMIFPSVARRAR
jgi:hypothetical protein